MPHSHVCRTGLSVTPRTYDAAVSISDELARARRLAFAADETSARDLLLSLIPQIEQEDRDDLMLEVLAQLGEIYLARGANDGVHESIRRIDDCLAIYTESCRTTPERRQIACIDCAHDRVLAAGPVSAHRPGRGPG